MKPLRCWLGLHDWTCAAEQGEPPPERLIGETVIEHFYRYATMFCARCGKVFKR